MSLITLYSYVQNLNWMTHFQRGSIFPFINVSSQLPYIFISLMHSEPSMLRENRVFPLDYLLSAGTLI